MPSDSFTITLHRHISGKEQVSLVDLQYLPRRHGEAWGGAPWGGKRPGCLCVGGRALQPVPPMPGACSLSLPGETWVSGRVAH